MAAPASSGYDRGCSICSRNKRLHHHHHRCRLNRNCRERLLLSLLLLFFHPSFPFLHSSFILSCPRDSFLSFVLSSFNPCPYFFFLIPSSFPFLLPSFLLPWVLLFPFLHDFVPSILLFFMLSILHLNNRTQYRQLLKETEGFTPHLTMTHCQMGCRIAGTSFLREV